MEIPNNQQQNPIKSQAPSNKTLNKGDLISLSFELGYIIAIPIVVLGLAGKWVDNHFHHSFPWVTLLGIGLAITTTTLWIIKRLGRYIKWYSSYRLWWRNQFFILAVFQSQMPTSIPAWPWCFSLWLGRLFRGCFLSKRLRGQAFLRRRWLWAAGWFMRRGTRRR